MQLKDLLTSFRHHGISKLIQTRSFPAAAFWWWFWRRRVFLLRRDNDDRFRLGGGCQQFLQVGEAFVPTSIVWLINPTGLDGSFDIAIIRGPVMHKSDSVAIRVSIMLVASNPM